MAYGGYPIKFMEELKNKNDIIDVISQRIHLDKKGINFWGCCPFHKEKTPSFSVNPQSGFYHCFGCGVGGDVIKFVMEYDGMTFPEAVEHLATRVGMTVPKTDTRLTDTDIENRKKEREALLSIIKDSLSFYEDALENSDTKGAMEYLAKRGVSKTTVKAFHLGLSPSGFGLVNYLTEKGYDRNLMYKSGVVTEREGRAYDSMSNRLIIPIFNHIGQCIAFGGRAMADGAFAKYKNTAETPIFIKSKTLFGLNKARELRQQLQDLIIVEGYMDCISLAQAGILNVVASMGTSLTEEQAILAKRYVSKVYICYDGDSAGQNATLRGLEILKNNGLEVMIMTMPKDLDPDDVVRKQGKIAFLEYKAKALPFLEYKLIQAKNGLDMSATDGKAKYARRAVDILSKETDPLIQDSYLPMVSELSSLSVARLSEVLRGGKATSKSIEQDKPLIVDKPIDDARRKKVEVATAVVLNALLNGKEYALNSDYRGLFQSKEELELYGYIQEKRSKRETFAPNIGYDFLPEQEATAALGVELPKNEGDEVDEKLSEMYFFDCLHVLRMEVYTRRKEELQAAYESAKTDIEKKMLVTMLSQLKKPQK